jgi:hypothetical protein
MPGARSCDHGRVMPSGHGPVILKIRYSTMTSVNMTGHDRDS